jgi:hypothetical protein
LQDIGATDDRMAAQDDGQDEKTSGAFMTLLTDRWYILTSSRWLKVIGGVNADSNMYERHGVGVIPGR